MLHAIYKFHNFHLIGFVLTTTAEKLKFRNWFTLDMLVVCSDIHVLGSPLMSAEATRMQDLAYEFSKIFRRRHPRTPTAGNPLPHPPGLWLGAGCNCAPEFGPNLGEHWTGESLMPICRCSALGPEETLVTSIQTTGPATESVRRRKLAAMVSWHDQLT